MDQQTSSRRRGQGRQRAQAGQAGWRSLVSRREARGALAIAVGLITIVALIPGNESTPTLIGWDKLDHVVSFAALSLLARAAFPLVHRWRPVAALILYGCLIELAQGTEFVGRTASISDLVANGIGIALGLGLAYGLAHVARVVNWPRERF